MESKLVTRPAASIFLPNGISTKQSGASSTVSSTTISIPWRAPSAPPQEESIMEELVTDERPGLQALVERRDVDRGLGRLLIGAGRTRRRRAEQAPLGHERGHSPQ